MTHTAGEWTAVDIGDGIKNAVMTPAKGKDCMTICCRGSGVDEKDDAANAKLIAAAPDLLELANAFVSFLEDDSRSIRRHDECRAQAHAVIRKATS